MLLLSIGLTLPIGHRELHESNNIPILLRELATDAQCLLGRVLMGSAMRLHRGKMGKGWKPSFLCQMEVVLVFHRQ